MTQTRRIMGVETEYSTGCFNAEDYTLYTSANYCGKIYSYLYEIYKPYSPSQGDGRIFFNNGSKFYVDYGDHPEFCTPECDNPTDAVRYILAGEHMLQAVSTASSMNIYKNNVDYLTGATWGAMNPILQVCRRSS